MVLILGRRKEQVEDGVVKTEPHLYKAFGSNRDNFANSLLMTRKMHDKKYSRYKQKEILAQKLSISFHPEDNDRLTYEQAYKIAEDFAREFFWSKGYALEGYKVDAVRYLIKDHESLEKAMTECMDTILEKMDYEENESTVYKGLHRVGI